jgi:hypothetical protein
VVTSSYSYHLTTLYIYCGKLSLPIGPLEGFSPKQASHFQSGLSAPLSLGMVGAGVILKFLIG